MVGRRSTATGARRRAAAARASSLPYRRADPRSRRMNSCHTSAEVLKSQPSAPRSRAIRHRFSESGRARPGPARPRAFGLEVHHSLAVRARPFLLAELGAAGKQLRRRAGRSRSGNTRPGPRQAAPCRARGGPGADPRQADHRIRRRDPDRLELAASLEGRGTSRRPSVPASSKSSRAATCQPALDLGPLLGVVDEPVARGADATRARPRARPWRSAAPSKRTAPRPACRSGPSAGAN